MKKLFLSLLCLSMITGCMSSVRERNAKNISKLSIGMTKEQVKNIMGNWSASQDQATVTNPYRIDMIKREDKTYEVLYYYTETSGASPPFAFRIRESDLTPLYFLDSKLVGLGKSFLLSQ